MRNADELGMMLNIYDQQLRECSEISEKHSLSFGGDYTNDLNFRNSTRRASKQSDNKPGKIPAVQVHKEKRAVPDSTVYEAK
jgi:hypothetical protein